MDENELKNIAPKLYSLKKENSFDVPENYFEKFPDEMMEKIRNEGKMPSRAKIYSILKPQLKLVAGFILLALTAFIMVKFIGGFSKTNDQYSENVVNVSEENAEELAAYGITDEDQIITVLLEEDTLSETDLSSDEIVEYLIDSDLDYLAYLEE
jgi:hypothetical protein